MQIVRCFENCPRRIQQGTARHLGIQLYDDHFAAPPVEKLELKDVLAPAREVLQVGKSSTNGVASTAVYNRGDLGWIYEFDRQASADIADHLESRALDSCVLCQVHHQRPIRLRQ